MHVSTSGHDHASPVLLLHGGGVAGWMWDSLRTRLDAGHRVFTPDLPGHGRSSGEPYVSHDETVAALARRVAALAEKPVTVIGFSLGAQLAIQLASQHPELVDRAVIISAQAKAMSLTGPTLALLGVTAPLARRRWFARLQARELFIPPDLMEQCIDTSSGITKETLLAAVGSNVRFELPAAWSTFNGRTLVMVGQRERRVMRASAEAIHAAAALGELEVVEGCGHGIPLQRPGWFNERVAGWLSEA